VAEYYEEDIDLLLFSTAVECLGVRGLVEEVKCQ
jgi:hypothetical protein